MADALTVSQEQSANRGVFFIEKDGARVAEMTYQRLGDNRILVDHTFVDPALRGGGFARQLLDAAVGWARQNNMKITAGCSYVIAQFARDHSLADVRD